MLRPVADNWPISQAFGVVAQLYTDLGYLGHHGLDIETPVGTEVHAADIWECITAKHDDPTAGNFIVLQHPNGLLTRYLHLSRIDVSVSDTGYQGQPIGLTGNTGLVSGKGHIHFEIIDPTQMSNGYKGRVDPELYFMEDGMTDAEKAEIARIADIFGGWARLRKARADLVNTMVGQYGIQDNLDAREATELQGAVDGLKALLG